MTIMATECDLIALLDEEMQLACEYQETGCDGAKAEWALVPRACCSAAQPRFACSGCKELKMTTENGVICGECNYWTVPARHHYVRCEHL